MAFVVTETTYSRSVKLSFDRKSASYELFGSNTLNDATARAGFIAVLPNPLVLTSPTAILYFQDMDVVPQGGGVWKCIANYQSFVPQANPGQGGVSPPPPPPPGPTSTTALGPEYSWDISSGSEKAVKSIATIDSVAVAEDEIALVTPKDYRGAIGVIERTGEIQGVDRIFPKAEFSVTKLFDFITLAYWKKVHRLVGTVNDDTFYTFENGELLFLGASGQPRDDTGKVAITFKFAVAFNQEDVDITDYLYFPVKKGWEYIWVQFKNKSDAGKIVSYPAAAYLEQIYKEEDFGQLEIGT